MQQQLDTVRATLAQLGVSTCDGAALRGERWATQIALTDANAEWVSMGGLCLSDDVLELILDIELPATVQFRARPRHSAEAPAMGAPGLLSLTPELAAGFEIEGSDDAWPWLSFRTVHLLALRPLDIELELSDGVLGVRLTGLRRGPVSRDVLESLVRLWRFALERALPAQRPLHPIPTSVPTLESLFPFDVDRLSGGYDGPRSALGASEALRSSLMAWTEAFSGVVERVGDREVARVSLEGHVSGFGAAPAGELTLELFASGAPRDLTFDGALPEGLPRATLFPEVGVRGFIASLREIEVGDRALDDAFIIRTDGDLTPLIDDVRPELLLLAPLGVSVELTGERLQVTLPSPRGDLLGPPVAAVLTLWRRLAQRALDVAHGPAA